VRAFRYLSLLTIGRGPVFAQSDCPQGGTTIFFSNGLNTNTAHALQSAINLSAAVKLRLAQTSNTASPGCLSFGWAPDFEFVESNSSIVSWANLLAQLEVAAGQEGVVLTPELLWGWMTAESPLPPPNWFTSFVGASVTSVVSAVQPDVRKQLTPLQPFWMPRSRRFLFRNPKNFFLAKRTTPQRQRPHGTETTGTTWGRAFSASCSHSP
jgi:hypothetical protein